MKLSKFQIQDRVWQFIHEFRDAVVSELEEKIDFIIIYGSAVRREFVPGKSDVDIVIQVLRDKDVVEKRASEIFFEIPTS